MRQSWYCSWWSGWKLVFCVHLEPGCVAFIAQWIKTIQEGMVLTPNQVKWSIFICTQIMQNARIRLPLGVSKYSANWMSSLFRCYESSGPSQRCLWLLVEQKLWHLWQLWWLHCAILTEDSIHNSQMVSLGVRRSQPAHVWRPLTFENIVIVSLSAVSVYSIYKSAE